MNLVDSCGWLEYLADTPEGEFFARPLLAVDRLIVPTICLHEVFKKVFLEKGEGPALQVVALMRQGLVVDLDAELAVSAARCAAEYRIPLADSIVVATAQRYQATIWTKDAHFRGLPRVCLPPEDRRT